MEESGESPTQKQARLRREKREAKIKAGGSSRLDKISSVSGGRVPEYVSPPASQAASSSFRDSAIHSDPAEVDLSTHPSVTDPSNLTSAQLQDLISAKSPPIPFSSSEPTKTFPPVSSNAPPQDPIAAMLQQLLSSGGAGSGVPNGNNPFTLPPNGTSPDGSFPPALASLLSGATNNNINASSSPSPPSRLAPLFRSLHLIASLAFAMLILHTTPSYDGSLSSRAPYLSATASARAAQVFWGFVATEVALLSGRAWIEGGGGQSGSSDMLVGLVAGFLPGVWAQLLRSAVWYMGVVRRGVEDAMVVVFVLGLVAWWRQRAEMAVAMTAERSET